MTEGSVYPGVFSPASVSHHQAMSPAGWRSPSQGQGRYRVAPSSGWMSPSSSWYTFE